MLLASRTPLARAQEVAPQRSQQVEDNRLRMTEICNNHPMFQFL